MRRHGVHCRGGVGPTLEGMPSHPTAPRRKPSAAVYRRRRQVVALAAVLVLLLVGWGLGALVDRMIGRGDPEAAPTTASPTPSAVSSPVPEAARSLQAEAEATAVDPATVAACEPSDLRLTASVDHDALRRGEPLVLGLHVVNLSSTPCRADVGTAQQEFVVADAAGAQVMSTRICQVDATHQDVALMPNQERMAAYTWSGRASTQDCSAQGPLAGAGPYRLTVSLGDEASRPVSFRLLANPDLPETPSPSAAASSSGALDSGSPAPASSGEAAPSSGDAAPSSGATSSAPASRAPGSASPATPAPATSAPASSASPSDG